MFLLVTLKVRLMLGIKWLSDMHMCNVDFVADSKTSNDAFHSNKPNVSEFVHIISGCERLFHSHFTNSRVKFNRRQTNTVAGALTEESCYQLVHYLFSYPHCITDIIVMKCIIIFS